MSSKNEPKQSKVLLLIYGFIHEFQKLNKLSDIKYIYDIPDEVITIIHKFGLLIIANPIIIVNGSKSITVSIVNEDKPRSIFRSIVGTSKENEKEFYIGNDALKKKSSHKLSLRYPIDFGLINRWDPMVCI